MYVSYTRLLENNYNSKCIILLLNAFLLNNPENDFAEQDTSNILVAFNLICTNLSKVLLSISSTMIIHLN